MAAAVAVTAGLGVAVAVLIGVAVVVLVPVDEDDLSVLEVVGWVLATLVATGLVAAVGARTVIEARRYIRGEDASGRRIASLLAATWVLWLVWGIPATGGWFSAALVLYTALVLPCLLVVWIVWRLALLVAQRRA
jgi:hypothetical protein